MSSGKYKNRGILPQTRFVANVNCRAKCETLLVAVAAGGGPASAISVPSRSVRRHKRVTASCNPAGVGQGDGFAVAAHGRRVLNPLASLRSLLECF